MTSGSAAAALPALHAVEAPAAWRAVDFISDLHLSPALPRTTQAWTDYLRTTTADAVFMLGDVFDAWVGDDARTLAFPHQCMQVLAAAARRCTLGFMVGNRDFLLGPAMLSACGMRGLADPTLLDAWGRRVLLSHGDALCLADQRYQAFRQQVRQPQWQAEFLARPLVERLAIAAEVRRQSQGRHQFDGEPDADLDVAAMLGWMQAGGAAEMVHGHTHRPGDEMLAPGFQRHVLSDWDLDDGAHPRAQVLRLTRDGFRRLRPTDAG
jgi:UDP-2,3-diacylglucosamine hydrolase